MNFSLRIVGKRILTPKSHLPTILNEFFIKNRGQTHFGVPILAAGIPSWFWSSGQEAPPSIVRHFLKIAKKYEKGWGIP
jgi:hypothetical protein